MGNSPFKLPGHTLPGPNQRKPSPARIAPLLVWGAKMLAGSLLSHGKKKDAEKMAAAEAEGRASQFQTPETKTDYISKT